MSAVRRRHWPTIWVDIEEPLLLLSVLGDVDLGKLVREPAQDAALVVTVQDRLYSMITHPSSSKVIEILIPFGV